MENSNVRAKLVVGVLTGTSVLHLVLAACGHSTSPPAQCQTNCTSSSSGPGLVPPGAMIAYAGAAAPDGWLLCDGTAVSRTQYAALFAAIGTAYGTGDGVGTFRLPDLRGRFLRGTDHGAAHDPDAASRTASGTGGSAGDSVGSFEAAAFASHKHNARATLPGVHTHIEIVVLPGAPAGPYNGPASTTYTGDAQYVGTAGVTDQWLTTLTTYNPGAHDHGITDDAVGGSETRPDNVGVNYIVKD
jgi:microcystin-dependent protein